MANVTLEGYTELGGYIVALCTAQHRNLWWSWAQFTPDLEFGDGRSMISVFRHQVPGVFSTKKESLDAAFEYARLVVEAGTVDT